MGSNVSHAANNNKDNIFLPQEIIQGEILPRLPVKTLVIFRCVCKSWNYFLTADPEFVKSHLTHHLSMDDSIMLRCLPTVNNYPKFHPIMSRELELGGSVNGLVCVYHYDFESSSITSVGIWNPATHQYKYVPLPPSDTFNIQGGKFAFDFGFGFDPIDNDYKVIFISTYRDIPLVAQVYSCNAGSWGKNSVTSTFISRGGHNGCPIIVRGRPYWYRMSAVSPDCCYVVSFDLQDEVFMLLPGINFVNVKTQHRVVANLRDSLAVMVYDFPHTTSRSVDVYILDESRGLWTKNYTIGPITIPVNMKLLHFFRDGDLLFCSDKYIKLVGIDHETHAIDRFKSGMYAYNNSRCMINTSYSFGYKESLVSVKGMYLLHVKKVGTNIVIIDRSF